MIASFFLWSALGWVTYTDNELVFVLESGIHVANKELKKKQDKEAGAHSVLILA